MAELQDPETSLAISTPVLIAAGAHDRITSTPIAETFASRMPNGRFLKLDGAEHEILLEQNHLRAKFWAAFDQFSAELVPVIND
jgi:lysophospholipase